LTDAANDRDLMVSTEDHSDSWRVGVLFSQTGVTSTIERTQLNATLLAIEEINANGGVLGRPVEPVIYDPASDPKKFRAFAERLFQLDRIRLLFGCYMSSTRKAVLPVVEGHRGLLFYPTLYEGFEYSRNCIYTGAAPNQNSIQLARFLLSTYGNRFLLVGSNYVYPYESNRLMADFVVQSKGKVLDEIYVPLQATEGDFDKVIARIKKTSPEVIFSTVVGTGTAAFYSAYRAAVRPGTDADRKPLHQRGGGCRNGSGGCRRAHHRGAVLRDALLAGSAALRLQLQGEIRRGCAGDGGRRSVLFPGASGDAGGRQMRLR
jgi:branched-chain amino acid transport system substrate-binding protein